MVSVREGDGANGLCAVHDANVVAFEISGVTQVAAEGLLFDRSTQNGHAVIEIPKMFRLRPDGLSHLLVNCAVPEKTSDIPSEETIADIIVKSECNFKKILQ